MNINNNINNILEKVPSPCKLIAVSKTQPVEKIREAYDAGQRRFGENKVQELISKQPELPNDIEWHMIGHLQTNKVKQVLPYAYLIHGVDSVKLLDEIDKQASKIGKAANCLLQIFIAREENKFGFLPSEVDELISSGKIENYKHIKILGLMGMATVTENREQIRGEFRGLRASFDKLKTSQLPVNMNMQELSMGMSGDFDIAVQEGSTMVRIGSAIFGAREYQSV